MSRRSENERRIKNDRRHQKSRKKSANRSHAVIEITHEELRAVTLSRSEGSEADQVRVMSTQWRHEATGLDGPQGVAELTSALNELANQHDLQNSKIQFVLGGEFCVTKAVRGTVEEVRSELQKVEQRSRLYLMLGPGEKVAVSRSRPLDARHQYAVVSVCNSNTLDTIHTAAGQAGLLIDSIEPALVSTSRAIGRLEGVPNEPCLLVHLNKTAVELGVCLDGSLLLDYRPGGGTDPQKLMEIIRTHLSRLQRHLGHQLRQPPPELKKVYLCGDSKAISEAMPAFAAHKHFDVEVIDPTKIQATWEFADPIKDSGAVPALGALLSTYLPKSELDVPNFMEHILASTREPIKPILIKSLTPIAAILLIAMAAFLLNLTKRQALARVQTQLDDLVVVQAKERELRLKRTAAEVKLTHLSKLAKSLHALPASKVVEQIGHCMPSDVWLNRLEIYDMKKIKIAGASYQEPGVYAFVNWLEQAPGFSDVALRSTRPGQTGTVPTVDFAAELNLTDWEEEIKEIARNE